MREGDTKYLGASRLSEKVAQPNSDSLANRREFVLKKKYLQKILNEMGFRCMWFYTLDNILSNMKKVKITILKTTFQEDLAKEYGV